jgi:Fe-S-cluster containining protein
MTLHLPPQQHFECTVCGRCCRVPWTIPVEPPAEAVIRESEAFQRRVREGYQPLVVVAERLSLARQEDKSCTFLDQDGCELHREVGGERKPVVCQTFPYLFTETPDGLFTSLSYACPAVLEDSGALVEESRPSLERFVEQFRDDLPQAPVVKDRVEVLRGSAMSWANYLKLEGEILRAFSVERPVQSLLGMAVHLVWTEPLEGDYPLPVTPLDSPYNFGGFDLQLLSMVSCNLIAITEDVSDPQERAQLGSLLWNGGRHQSSKFGIELPAFELLQPAHPETALAIERYVRQAIFGKRLLIGTIVSRLLGTACGLTILLFY